VRTRRVGRAWSLLASLVAIMGFAGCAALFYDDAIKLCRSMIPAFNGADTQIEISRADAGTTVHGTLVTIAYVARRGAAGRTPRAISCIVRDDGQRNVRQNGRLQLTNLATENGPLGEERLHLLRRFWINSGLAAVSDPAPIALSGFVPEVPRGAAEVLQLLLSSLAGLSIYTLLAAAYALIYGLIGRINLAFGELAMLAGYGTFLGFAMVAADGPLSLAVLAAVIVGLFTCLTQGAALGHLVLARLVDRPGQHILIATIGLSIFWSEAVRLAQGSGNRWLSPLLTQPIGVARADTYIVTVTPMGLLVPYIGICAILATLVFLERSRFGRAWRATADDAFAAALFGINPAVTLLRTMLASALAGLGGILTTLTYGGVGHAGGLVIGLKALIAAVIGGIGSVRAAVLGALLLGLAETAWSWMFRIEYRDLAIFIGLAAALVLRPEGLFQRK
jgi:branched-chain amino acid transport system permease protein